MKRYPRPEPTRNTIIGATWAIIFVLLLTLVGVLAASGWVR